MIIATILNTKTKEVKDIQFRSLESAAKVINALNSNKPEIGFLMLVDWEAAYASSFAAPFTCGAVANLYYIIPHRFCQEKN